MDLQTNERAYGYGIWKCQNSVYLAYRITCRESTIRVRFDDSMFEVEFAGGVNLFWGVSGYSLLSSRDGSTQVHSTWWPHNCISDVWAMDDSSTNICWCLYKWYLSFANARISLNAYVSVGIPCISMSLSEIWKKFKYVYVSALLRCEFMFIIFYRACSSCLIPMFWIRWYWRLQS